MADIHGTFVMTSQRNMGDEFSIGASSSATTLTLTDVSDFDEHGGWVTIAGNVYAYDTIDLDADTVHLTSGLLAGTAAGDRVDIWDNDNSVVVSEQTALVNVDDQGDGDPLSVDVDHSLASLLSQGTLVVGQSVSLTPDGESFRLTAVHGKNNSAVQRSTAAAVSWGLDMGNGTVAGLRVVTGGTTVQINTITDARVKTPDAASFMPILASAFTVSSDAAVKTQPTKAPDALGIIAAAPAKHWRYKSDPSDVKRIGPMADDLPDWLAQPDPEDGHLMVDLARQVGVLWAAFGQQLEVNAELRARVDKLEKGER